MEQTVPVAASSDISIQVKGGEGMGTDEKLRVVRAALNKAINSRKPTKKASAKPKASKLKKTSEKKKKKTTKKKAKPQAKPKKKKAATPSKKSGNIIFNF